MGRSSKNKGSDFERKVCRLLTRWITGKTDPVIFWRTAGSGSQFTRQRGCSKMCGDIMAISSEGEFFTNLFCIECKFYEKIPFLALISSKGCNLVSNWWKKLCEQSLIDSKLPFLFFKENYQPIYIMFPRTIYCEFETWVGSPSRFLVLNYEDVKVVVMEWNMFSEWLDPEVVRTYARKEGYI